MSDKKLKEPRMLAALANGEITAKELEEAEIRVAKVTAEEGLMELEVIIGSQIYYWSVIMNFEFE